MQIPSNQAKEVRSEKFWQLTLQRATLNIYYEKALLKAFPVKSGVE